MAETRLVAISIDCVTIGDIMRITSMSKLGAQLATTDGLKAAEILDEWCKLALAQIERYTNCAPSLATALSMVEFGSLLQAISRETEAAQARWASGDHAPTTALCTVMVGEEIGNDNN
jgi:hypothetical protein